MRKKRSGLLKVVCVIVSAALLCSMCGCGGRELYERLLIHGVGVDADGEEFVVTVRSSISPEDEGEEYFECRGRSVLEALNSLALSTGRKPFYAHNYLVVFGEECARLGLDRCLDFFVRYYNTRPAVQMYLADGEAKDILSFKVNDRYLKMSELQQLGDSSRDTGRTVGVEILDFVNGVKRQGGSPMLPVLRAEKEKIAITSTAYFDGYVLKGFLNLQQTRGFLAVKNRLSAGEAVIKTQSHGTVTLTLAESGGGIQLNEKGGALPDFLLKAKVVGDVSAVSGGRSQMEAEGYGAIEEQLANEIKSEIRAAVNQAVIEDGCDIFGFGALIYRKNPEYWQKLRRNWNEAMSKCEYKIEVTASVKRLEQEELENHAG